MRKPNRISMQLFDQELIDLMNAAAKIFPMSQEDIDSHNNPDGYEYGRVGNHIYRWRQTTQRWEYIIADDVDIPWSEIKDKPSKYPPSEHTHEELHTHSNKDILDGITSSSINLWDSVSLKANEEDMLEALSGKSSIGHTHDERYSALGHTHPYALLGHDHDDLYYPQESVDTMLSSKSPIEHNHDGAYYKKSETDSKLSLKSNVGHTHQESDIKDLDKYTRQETDNFLAAKANKTHTHKEQDIIDLDKYTQQEVDVLLLAKSEKTHTHPELHTHSNKSLLDKLVETSPEVSYDLSNLQYIEDIRAGYTEGHAHNNMVTLNKITEIKLDGWDNAVQHINDGGVHVTLTDKQLWDTVENKALIGHNHDDVYSPLDHTHDNRYSTKSEVAGQLAEKSDAGHTHADKADKSFVTAELSKKADNTTLAYHTNNEDIHVTKAKKTEWDSKAAGNHNHTLAGLSEKSYNSLTNKPSIPTKLSQLNIDMDIGGNSTTLGNTKPTDGSLWLEVIE